MLVKWGEDEVYISIGNWVAKVHDKIQKLLELRCFLIKVNW
jgi:hypothetical protein